MMRFFVNPNGYGQVKVRLAYDGEILRTRADDDIRPLDPIDPSLVGRLRVAALLRFAHTQDYRSLEKIIETIARPEVPACLKNVPPCTSRPQIKRCYEGHFEHLKQVNIVEHAHLSRLLWLSGYFAVDKTEQSMRSIFNGNRLSKVSDSPPPVNLMSTADIIRLFRSHLRKHRRMWIVQADLRHWFHQILVDPELRQFFGLQMGTESFRWRTLPMGWSWSPAIAQALAWTLLTYHGQDQPIDLYETTCLKDPHGRMPFYIPLKGERGSAFVYYDNIVIMCDEQNTAQMAAKALRTSAKIHNARIKETAPGEDITVAGPADLVTGGVDVLGIRFKLHRTPDQGKDPKKWHSFSATPAKAERWLEKEEPTSVTTAREVASEVGRFIFSSIVTYGEVYRAPHGACILRTASALGKHAARVGWDAVFKAPPDFDTARAAFFAELRCPTVRSVTGARQLLKKEIPILATDSSTPGFGWLFCDKNGKQLGSATQGFWRAEDERHIYLKELHAALAGLRDAKSRGYSRVILVVDNVDAAWTLRHGFTRSEAGMELLNDFWDVLGIIQRIVTVISADNPGDEPSRGAPVETERIMRMMTAVEASERGAMTASKEWKGGPWSGEKMQIRHEMYEEDLEDFDDDE